MDLPSLAILNFFGAKNHQNGHQNGLRVPVGFSKKIFFESIRSLNKNIRSRRKVYGLKRKKTVYFTDNFLFIYIFAQNDRIIDTV